MSNRNDSPVIVIEYHDAIERLAEYFAKTATDGPNEKVTAEDRNRARRILWPLLSESDQTKLVMR